MDWDGFTDWLEADPRHRAALDALVVIDDAVTTRRDEIARQLPAPLAAPTRRRWPIVISGGLAAALALAIGWPAARPDRVWRATERAQTIALDGGIRAVLAPHSRLVAAGGDDTRLALAGAAYFDVPHRDGRTLAITAGAYTVRDIGTRFEIVADRHATKVAVAEGRLSVTADTLERPVALAAGKVMLASDDGVTLARQPAAAVASWRSGRLVYDAAPLALVAADIGRYAGRRVTLDPRIAGRRFSGVLIIGDGTGLGQDVATILGVSARDDGARLLLEPRG